MQQKSKPPVTGCVSIVTLIGIRLHLNCGNIEDNKHKVDDCSGGTDGTAVRLGGITEGKVEGKVGGNRRWK